MFTIDPRDALTVAHDHGSRLRAETAAERLRLARRSDCPLEALLRRFARRLERASVAPRTA